MRACQVVRVGTVCLQVCACVLAEICAVDIKSCVFTFAFPCHPGYLRVCGSDDGCVCVCV